MHPNPRRILPVILLLAFAGGAWWYFSGRPAEENDALSASGTIEATEISIGPETGGRVIAVNVAEGEAVQAGDVLIQFDTELLEMQRQQAAAAADAAQSALAAAAANHELLKAGPSAEQLGVAKTVVDRAQIAADAAQESFDSLPEAAQKTTEGKSVKQQLDLALAALANSRAQYDQVRAGARPEQLAAARAQMDAAAAQVEAARAAIAVLDVQLRKLTLTAPVDGVVLSRAIQPGEVASPGATLLVIGQLEDLRMTVYLPEDRYGMIRLGQSARVSVDSFPGETFAATVAQIANQAEFTPRNVQTAEGRKTTVFAIRLSVVNPSGKLKPGMPADVAFEGN